MGLTFTIWSNLKVFLHYIYNDSRPSLSEYLLNYVSTNFDQKSQNPSK